MTNTPTTGRWSKVRRWLADRWQILGFVLIVCAVAWSSFATARTNDHIRKVQDESMIRSRCVAQNQHQFLQAINDRNRYTDESSKLVQRVYAAQLVAVAAVTDERVTVAQAQAAAKRYAAAVREYQTVLAKSQKNRQAHPYPEPNAVRACINDGGPK